MPRNGSGTYSLPAGQPVTTGTTISSTTHNTLMADVANALTGSLAADGQTPATANLPMGGYKHTNVASATARTEYATAGQVQDGVLHALTGVGGTANAITATAPVSMAAYATGQRFSFVVGTTNTAAATINVNAIAAKTIKKNGTQDLGAGDLLAGSVAELFYDGTYFQLVSRQSGAPAFCAYRSGSVQLVANATNTQVFMQTEEFDTDGAYDNATNYRFTPQVAGYYFFSGQITGYASGGSLTNVTATIRKNLNPMRTAVQNINFNATSSTVQVNALIALNGSTDYVSLWGQVSGASGQGFFLGQSETFLQGHFVRPL